MPIVVSIKNAFKYMRTHKSRSFLTMLGIVIGIAAVMVVMAVGASGQGLIADQINNMGSNLVGVLPGASNDNGPPPSAMGIVITTLKYEDALALGDRQHVPHAIAVAAYAKGVVTITWQGRSADTTLTGVTANYGDVEKATIERGRFYDSSEEKTITRVVVLGSTVADTLFEGADPLGQTVKIKRENFKVIGVMARRGTAFFINQDDQVFVPLVTAQKILLGVNHLGLIRMKIDQPENVEQSIADVEATLREQHNVDTPLEDDFTVRSTLEALDVFTSVTNALKFFLAAIAAIALVVGGIGIMNIMLVSVNERIREIGLRKAVGATNNQILIQFLVETIVVTLTGGILGVMVGGLIAGLVALVANLLGYHWQFIVSLESIILACGVSITIGLIFGVYPARRAAALDPITALRYE